MQVDVRTHKEPLGSPVLVSPDELDRRIGSTGAGIPEGTQAVGFTVGRVGVQRHGLDFAGGVGLHRVMGGTLHLTLTQEVLLSNALRVP